MGNLYLNKVKYAKKYVLKERGDLWRYSPNQIEEWRIFVGWRKNS